MKPGKTLQTQFLLTRLRRFLLEYLSTLPSKAGNPFPAKCRPNLQMTKIPEKKNNQNSFYFKLIVSQLVSERLLIRILSCITFTYFTL